MPLIKIAQNNSVDLSESEIPPAGRRTASRSSVETDSLAGTAKRQCLESSRERGCVPLPGQLAAAFHSTQAAASIAQFLTVANVSLKDRKVVEDALPSLTYAGTEPNNLPMYESSLRGKGGAAAVAIMTDEFASDLLMLRVHQTAYAMNYDEDVPNKNDLAEQALTWEAKNPEIRETRKNIIERVYMELGLQDEHIRVKSVANLMGRKKPRGYATLPSELRESCLRRCEELIRNGEPNIRATLIAEFAGKLTPKQIDNLRDRVRVAGNAPATVAVRKAPAEGEE
jgi:hypothetical protein